MLPAALKHLLKVGEKWGVYLQTFERDKSEGDKRRTVKCKDEKPGKFKGK